MRPSSILIVPIQKGNLLELVNPLACSSTSHTTTSLSRYLKTLFNSFCYAKALSVLTTLKKKLFLPCYKWTKGETQSLNNPLVRNQIVKEEVDWVHVKDTKELFINTGYTGAWILGVTTEVDLRGTRFSFLCRDHMYFVLPRLWRGNCVIAATLSHVVYHKAYKITYSGLIPNMGSFLE